MNKTKCTLAYTVDDTAWHRSYDSNVRHLVIRIREVTRQRPLKELEERIGRSDCSTSWLVAKAATARWACGSPEYWGRNTFGGELEFKWQGDDGKNSIGGTDRPRSSMEWYACQMDANLQGECLDMLARLMAAARKLNVVIGYHTSPAIMLQVIKAANGQRVRHISDHADTSHGVPQDYAGRSFGEFVTDTTEFNAAVLTGPCFDDPKPEPVAAEATA